MVVKIDTTKFTKSQIRANREKWANFLLRGRKKTQGTLDDGGGARCCLGHGAYCLGVEHYVSSFNTARYGANRESSVAPIELIEMVGLWDTIGGPIEGKGLNIRGKHFYDSLANANDHTSNIGDTAYEPHERKPSVSPRDIGLYLLTVLDGGPETPWRSINEYADG